MFAESRIGLALDKGGMFAESRRDLALGKVGLQVLSNAPATQRLSNRHRPALTAARRHRARAHCSSPPPPVELVAAARAARRRPARAVQPPQNARPAVRPPQQASPGRAPLAGHGRLPARQRRA